MQSWDADTQKARTDGHQSDQNGGPCVGLGDLLNGGTFLCQ